MPGLVSRIKAFGRSPKGRQSIASAQRAARNPANQQKARQVFGKLRGRRTR